MASTAPEEKIEWQDRPTCMISTAPQGGPRWHQLRLYSISMSNLSQVCGRGGRYQVPAPQLARRICGLEKEVFSEEAMSRMSAGNRDEPMLRAWHSALIKKPIYEVGVGVWKQDPRFRGSMDGDLDDGTFAEYKTTQQMYRAYIEFIESLKYHTAAPPSPYRHIFDSHYDQMTGNAIIHGKTACRYIVYARADAVVYMQDIPVDRDHWDKLLYPTAVKFYTQEVEPLLAQHQLQRIDPPIVA